MSTYTHRLAAAAVAPHPAAFGELSPISRARTTEVLSRLLIELLDITLCVRHANWNARGPDFLLLSDLLEEAGAKLDEQANRLARRIRALGGVAHATAHTIATEFELQALSDRGERRTGPSEGVGLEARTAQCRSKAVAARVGRDARPNDRGCRCRR